MKVTIERNNGAEVEHDDVAGIERKPNQFGGYSLTVWIDEYEDYDEGSFYLYPNGTVISTETTDEDVRRARVWE